MIETRSVYDLCFQALREAGIASLGDTVDADVMNETLLTLNMYRAENSIDSMNQTVYDATYTATTNTNIVTLGTSTTVTGNFPVRPVTIDAVYILLPGDIGTVPSLKLTLHTWEEFRDLPIQYLTAIPSDAYYDLEYPIQNIRLYPGLASSYTVRVVGMKQSREYESLDDRYVDPPEMFPMLVYGVAARMCALYQFPVSQDLLGKLDSVRESIRTRTVMSRIKAMPSQITSASGWNFMSGLGR